MDIMYNKNITRPECFAKFFLLDSGCHKFGTPILKSCSAAKNYIYNIHIVIMIIRGFACLHTPRNNDDNNVFSNICLSFSLPLECRENTYLTLTTDDKN